MTECFDCGSGPCYMNCGPAVPVAAIHIAHAVSRKCGTSYRVRGFVLDRGVKHSFSIGLGDSVDEAAADAIRYIRDMHRQEGLTAPETIVDHGRLSGAIVDASAF